MHETALRDTPLWRSLSWPTHDPAPGLLVLHVGPNDRPASPQVRVQLVPAHGRSAPRRMDLPEPARIPWPQEGKTELVRGSVRLSGIGLVDDVICLEVGPAPN
jgi:hypothetical protein